MHEEPYFVHLEALQRNASQAVTDLEVRCVFLVLAGNLSGLVLLISSVLSRQICDARFVQLPASVFALGMICSLAAAGIAYRKARELSTSLLRKLSAGYPSVTLVGVLPENRDASLRQIAREHAIEVEESLRTSPRYFALLIAAAAALFLVGGAVVFAMTIATPSAVCVTSAVVLPTTR